MKNYFLVSIVFITLAAVIVFSCSKQETEIAKIPAPAQEFLPTQSDVSGLIKSFKASYSQYKAGIKSGTDYPLQEALWLVEASVNYDFRCDKDSLAERVQDSLVIVVQSSTNSEGQVIINEDDVMQAYETLTGFTEGQLLAQGDGSRLFIADLAVLETNGSETTMELTTVTGKPTLPSCNIQSNDYWCLAGGLGKCDLYQGQNIGQDAATRLNFIFNCTNYACNGTIYFTSVVTIAPHSGYHSGPANQCLSPDDLKMQWMMVGL